MATRPAVPLLWRDSSTGSPPDTPIYGNILGGNLIERLALARESVDAACIKAARDSATLRRTVAILTDLPGSEGDSMADWMKRFRSVLGTTETGTPDELAGLLRAVAREGVDHVQL